MTDEKELAARAEEIVGRVEAQCMSTTVCEDVERLEVFHDNLAGAVCLLAQIVSELAASRPTRPDLNTDKLFDLLEGVEAAWVRTDPKRAQDLAAGFARATGGADMPWLVEQLSAVNTDKLREALEDKWKELDPHRTSVIYGVPDDFYGDDPRINVFDEKVDAGEEPKLTIGLFLGQHKWVMQRFSPEQCVGIAGMLLSKPSVIATLTRLSEAAK